MSFKVDISGVLKGLDDVDRKLKAAVALYSDTAGKKLEQEAKTKAGWTDRTALARQTIQGGYEWQGPVCYIYVTGNTDYFPYLELANEKRFAVLYPTIQQMQPSILKGLDNLLGR